MTPASEFETSRLKAQTSMPLGLVPSLPYLPPPLRAGLRRLGMLALAVSSLLTGCKQNPDSTAGNPSGRAASASGAKKLTIALLPKSKGNAYFKIPSRLDRHAQDLELVEMQQNL